MADENHDTNVDFLYKAMLERDPSKRRVKPVQRHMLQMDFAGLEDSSDDSDFQVNQHKDSDGSDDDDIASSEEDEAAVGSSDDSQVDNGQGSVYSVGSPSGDVPDQLHGLGQETGHTITPPAVVTIPSEPSLTNQSTPVNYKEFRILVCSVCLGDGSEETNEIVECDGCGIAVHEGCYGVSETQSVASTVSSASTEPWFCDACKAGVTPTCDLCPNFGGIYKETDSGRWVHMVCALYVPGVAFADVEKLSPVTLFEMPYAKWGAKECLFCEDERFSRTGVCIGCDAGMCRAFFHVTCAQREGLLSEASPDEEIADPFYAYCKQHADKSLKRIKRRNFLAAQSAVKPACDGEKEDSKEQLRVTRKLNGHRHLYQESKITRTPSWVPTEKVVRMLSSSASAMRALFKKAELLGIHHQVAGHSISQKDIRKKWHIPAAFSPHFVEYFLDRNSRISNMRSLQGELMKQHHSLKAQESQYRRQYDKLNTDVVNLRSSNHELRDAGKRLWAVIKDLGQKKELPAVLRAPPKRPRTHSTDDSLNKSFRMRSPPSVIHSCGTCGSSHDQHLLTRCDECSLYYHLACLDPPLTRMPKKTKQFEWHCSQCARDDSDDGEHKNVNAPRRLRELSSLREPSKYTPFITRGVVPRAIAPVRPASRATTPVKVASRTTPPTRVTPPTKIASPIKHSSNKLHSAAAEDMAVNHSVVESPTRAERKSVEREPVKLSPSRVLRRDFHRVCVVCNERDDTEGSVRCDGCGLCYHLGCLDPPAKRSPKVHGYSWLCVACDHLKTSSDEDRKCQPKQEANNTSQITEEGADPIRPTRAKRLLKPTEKSLCLEEIAAILKRRTPSKAGPRRVVSKPSGIAKPRRRPKRSFFSSTRRRRMGTSKKPDPGGLVGRATGDDVKVPVDGDSVMPELEQESMESESRLSVAGSPHWSPVSEDSGDGKLSRQDTPPPPTLSPETS